MPPRRAKAAPAAPEPAPSTRSRPSRAAATTKRAPPKARVPSSSDEEEEEEQAEEDESVSESSEEDVKPVINRRAGRTSGRSSALSTSTKPQPAKPTSSRTSARQSNVSAASAPPKAEAKGKPAGRASAAAKKAPPVESESDDDEEQAEESEPQTVSSSAEEAPDGDEGDGADEDVESEPSPAPKSRNRRAETLDSSPVPMTGPSDVKPLVRGRGKKRISLLPPPESSSAEEDDAAADEEEEDDDDEEEEEVRPRTPAKKGKGKRVVASSEDEDEEEDEAPAPAQAVAVGGKSDSESEAEVAADLSATPTRARVKAEEVDLALEEVAEEDEEAEITNEPIPIKKDETPGPSQAGTGFDLAAAARMAALNHAAREKEREKEREGKPRLVIHQMVLEDFKSYRGRGIIGPFHKSFSAVVGPNGSGKSNTIDALLFVFGYRANKMRQGKLSELIHNSGAAPAPDETDEDGVGMPARAPAMDGANEGEYGSDEDSDDAYTNKKKGKKGKGKKSAPEPAQAGLIDSCTVEVWFREIIDLPGRDEFTIVPGSQLVVARTAYRNNSSKYTINGKTSTFTEVTTLLKGRGIDLQHKRFLILQGEVESIAQMKPKGVTEHDEGLLEYLEDIIGTSEYKPDIEAAVVEVDRLNEERAVQLNRVKLVEREKSSLEGRKKECDSYLRDQNELAHNQSALFQVNIHQASLNAQVATEAVTEAQAALEEETEAQGDIRREAEELQAEYDTLVADLKSVEKETAEVVKQLAALDKTDVQLQERKKSSSAKIKKLKKAITDDTHARSEATTWVTNHGETITRVGADLTKMEAKLEAEEAELDKVREGLKGKTEVFTAQVDTLQAELQPWAAKVAEKRAEIDLVVNERDLLTERGESVRVGIEEAQATLERLTADAEAKQEILASLAAEKKEVESGLRKLEGQFNQSQAQDQQLRAKVNTARQKADEARASQSASRSQNNVLNSLTKLSQQGRLPGFYGRLGNLGRIDDRYDVAISTACPGLDNLVTDNVKNGQACIEHLRKNDLGRATIMCIESIQQKDTRKIQTPENAPRLFDLVTPKEPKYAALFFHLLTNTLVANDLDQGNRLAFGSGNRRWRVVTLDGQLIETSGAMSGGGGRPQRGRMSNKIAPDEVSPEVVARYEQDQRSASEELQRFSEDRAKIERELNNFQRRLPEIETTISKVQMDLNTGAKRAEEAENRLAELQGQTQPEAGEEQRIAQLEKQAKSLNKELAKLQDETQSIESKIKVLQEKILEVGGVKLRTQQSKVQDLKAQIDLATDRLTKAEVGMAKSDKDAAKLAKNIESNQASLEATESDLAELNEQIANGSADSDLVRTSVEQAQAVLDEKKDELGEMKKVLDEKVAVTVQFRKRELELKQTLESERKVLKDNEKLVKYWSEKLGDLQLNEIDEDDDEDEDDANPDATPKPPKADTVLREWTANEIAHLDLKVVTAKIAALEERISKTNLDLSVLKEYARREKEFMQRAADLDAVTKQRDGAKQLADDLRAKRLREFMEGFGIISMKLKEMYQLITLGGNAELELVDSLDPFSEGIIFSVMPPKKSWKNISNLSGGEKTLSSLALVFALHVFKPTPLYFMDEIDAALDFRNVSIVANYIRDRTKQAQFVVISLRNNMFELSSRLIGIYKVANQTRSVAIDNSDLHQLAITAAA